MGLIFWFMRIIASLMILQGVPATKATAPTTTTTTVSVTTTTIAPVVLQHPGGRWICIRWRESKGDYTNADTGRNGHYGAYQFSPGTWNYAVGLIGQSKYANGRADKAPPSVQDAAAVALQAKVGWSPWAGNGC